MHLLERDEQLRVLEAVLERAADRRGRVVLVEGPAGIGKTSLVRAFARRAEAQDATVRIGACDDLLTARAFAPFRDVARGRGRLGRALRDGAAASEVLDAILEELDDPLHPVVVVLEDVQWADDATLDALMVIARRIERLPAVVVATFRDEEIDRGHPLRRVLGALGAAGVERIGLQPLSRTAVGELVGRGDEELADLYRATGGNPFYALELAAAPDGAVPTSVRDAVLSRVLGLPATTQQALETLSVVPTAAERWLIDAVIEDGSRTLDAAERAGLVSADAVQVAFAHEIARRAVESDLPAGTRVALNASVLAVLAAHDADRARILHHAVEAGDATAVLRHGPIVAREAARLGSHREALAAYGQVHRFAAALPADERAALAREYAYELQLGNRHSEAVALATEAVGLLERADDPEALADALLVLSRAAYWHAGEEAALPHARRAVSLVEDSGPSAVLAMAYAHVSRLHLLANRNDETLRWATRALDIATTVGHLPAEAGARISRGAAAAGRSDEAGLDEVRQGLELARRHGFHETVIRGYLQLAVEHLRRGRLTDAEAVLHEGRAYAADNQVVYATLRMDGLLGTITLNRGDTVGAIGILRDALEGEGEPGVAGVQPRSWLARACARTGATEAMGLANEAWALAASSSDGPLLGAAAVAMIEAAWLTGAPDRVDDVAARALDAIDATSHPWYSGDLRVALQRAGRPVPEAPTPGVLLDAHAAALRGDHAEAASRWGRLGYRYEHAVELVFTGDERSMLDGLRSLDELGVTATAGLARAMLRGRGVTSVPRGPTRGTRRNPAGLTNRQVEVLELLADGLTNAEIADRLVVSVRTVDHHVSAVLDKLGVSTRRQAAAMAPTLGIGA